MQEAQQNTYRLDVDYNIKQLILISNATLEPLYKNIESELTDIVFYLEQNASNYFRGKNTLNESTSSPHKLQELESYDNITLHLYPYITTSIKTMEYYDRGRLADSKYRLLVKIDYIKYREAQIIQEREQDMNYRKRCFIKAVTDIANQYIRF